MGGGFGGLYGMLQDRMTCGCYGKGDIGLGLTDCSHGFDHVVFFFCFSMGAKRVDLGEKGGSFW